jgi:hypothetical protein
MRNFWISFCNGFKGRQFIQSLIEWLFFIVFFSFINHLFHDGADSSFATMVAGSALFIAINSQRRLDKK